eukprot:gene19127-19491_t
MENETSYIPDEKTLTSAMLNCRDSGHDEVALEIFDLALKSNLPGFVGPDRIMFGIAIACSMSISNDCSKAEELFAICDRKFKLGKSTTHKEEDAAIFAAVIFAYERFGQRDKVLDYFSRVRSISSMKPSAGMINAALRAASKSQQWPLFEEIEGTLALFSRTVIETVSAPDGNSSAASPPPVAIPSLKECSSALRACRGGEEVGRAIYKVSSASPGGEEDRVALVTQLTNLLYNPQLVDSAKLRRRVHRLIDSLQGGLTVPDTSAVRPTLQIYTTLIQSAGLRGDGPLAFRYFDDAMSRQEIPPDRALFRSLIEACSLDPSHPTLVDKARSLLMDASGSLSLVHLDSEWHPDYSESDSDSPSYKAAAGSGLLQPEAGFFSSCEGRNILVRNGLGMQSAATRKLIAAVKQRSDYRIDITALPERGARMPSIASAKQLLSLHCEKQALAAGLLADKAFPSLITVNLCLCNDCHAFFKAVSLAFASKLSCRDPSRLHVFENGNCSCNEFWGGR